LKRLIDIDLASFEIGWIGSGVIDIECDVQILGVTEDLRHAGLHFLAV